jgi:hypothetical protein
MLVFDNASHARTHTTRVIEYAVDPDSQTAKVVWDYPSPGDQFVSFLGDARRLPSDDVLVAFGPGGKLEEVDRALHLKWRLWSPPNTVVGRVRFLTTLSPSE